MTFYSNDIFIAIAGYLLGAIASAYIVVKLATGKDVRREGSGNVGAFNAYEVASKKWVGAAVLALDFAKGAAAVAFGRYMMGDHFQSAAIGALFCILGHNYNVFLKFKGGRGLACVAGAFALLNPVVIYMWGAFWIIGYFLIKRHVHFANAFATILSPIMLYNAPSQTILYFNSMPIWLASEYRAFYVIICVLILIKHIEPLVKLFRRKKD